MPMNNYWRVLISAASLCLPSLSRINNGDSEENFPTTISKIMTHAHGSYSDPKSIESKEGMCDGYDGILRVQSGDIWAAAGTSFFMYPINQILYAEQNKLIPWVHFTEKRSQIYDADVHDIAPTTDGGRNPVSFTAMVGTKITEIRGEGDLFCLRGGVPYPGPPDYENSDLRQMRATLDTSGVWEHYFEPISAFQPQHMKPVDINSCGTKPFIELSPGHLEQGLHVCAPWAVRSWPYKNLPMGNRPVDSLHNWLGKMREHGSRIVAQYIHPKPWLEEQVNLVNPINNDNKSNNSPSTTTCLALHIRHTDKSGHRTKVSLDEFLPYAETFVANGGEIIYLATDQTQNVERIKNEWPIDVSIRVRRQDDAFLSDSDAPIFHSTSHHRANTEALIDIFAMSRCAFIVHGFSAISEAAIYVGDLHHYSINLEDPEHMSLFSFAEKVHDRILS